jgi:hypothetical protein
MTSTYEWGKYEERVIEEHLNTTAGPFPWVAYPFVDDIGPGTDIFYLQNIVLSGSTSEGRMFSGYGTNNETALNTIQSFRDIFPAFITTNGTSGNQTMRYKTWWNGLPFNRQLEYNPWLPPSNVSTHMDRLAMAMTNVIRSAPSKTMLKGQAYSKETFVSITWAWLAFPFLLLSFSLVFLVATILKTSGDGPMSVWKTSAMPTLIYGLPQDVQKEVSVFESAGKTSRKRTGKVRIKLLPDRGWRVSGRMSACTSPTVTRENGPPGWI